MYVTRCLFRSERWDPRERERYSGGICGPPLLNPPPHSIEKATVVIGGTLFPGNQGIPEETKIQPQSHGRSDVLMRNSFDSRASKRPELISFGIVEPIKSSTYEGIVQDAPPILFYCNQSFWHYTWINVLVGIFEYEGTLKFSRYHRR